MAMALPDDVLHIFRTEQKQLNVQEEDGKGEGKAEKEHADDRNLPAPAYPAPAYGAGPPGTGSGYGYPTGPPGYYGNYPGQPFDGGYGACT